LFFEWKGRRPCDGKEVDLEVLLQRVLIRGEWAIMAVTRDITERKRGERELQLAKQRLDLALTGAELGIWDWFDTGEVRYDRGWANMLGYEVEDLEPDITSWHRLAHPDDIGPTMQRLEACLKGLLPMFDTTFRLRHRDGHWVHVLSRGRVTEKDHTGKPKRITGIHLDITKQKQAEEALRESEAMLRGFFDANAVRMCVMELHGEDLFYVRPNQRFADFFHLPIEQVAGKSGRQLSLAEETIQEWAERCRQCLRTGEPLSLEYSLKLEGESQERWYLGTLSPIPPAPNARPRFALTAYEITERKRAEEAVRHSEEKLRLIFNSTYDSIVIHTADGTILDVNETMARAHGVSRERLLRARVQDLFADEASEETARQIWARVLAGEPQLFEWKGKRLGTGQVVDSEIFLHPMQLNGSTVILANIRDITERKRAQEALELANRKITTILESITEAFVAWDENWRYVYVNSAAERALNIRRDELLGRDVREVFPCIVDTSYYKAYARAMAERITVSLEHCDPKERWYFVQAYPSFDGGLSVFFRDITEQKRAEKALQESESRFRSIFDTAALGIARAAPDGRLLEVNDCLCRMLGYSRRELQTKTFQEITHPEDLPSNLAQIQLLVAGKIKNFSIEKRYVRKDGSIVWVDTTGALKRKTDGTPDYFVAMIQDISDRKATEAALARAQEELREHAHRLEQHVQERTAKLTAAVNELEAFSYSIAHDLRAPLRGIHGFGTILKRAYGDKLGPDGEELIERINASAERMDRLIRDVLDYSKVVREEMRLEPVNLDKLVDDIVEGYPELQDANADIKVEGRMPWVQANIAALTQCISNLLGNAVKFVEPGVRPRIRVWSETKDHRVRLYVRDNGIGIPKHATDRIFQIFQRLHSESEYEGTGIGLAIVRRSVERMGGSVGVESEVGKGSTFWIELNAAR
jgi:PAS domain S-box-containing protein